MYTEKKCKTDNMVMVEAHLLSLRFSDKLDKLIVMSVVN